jgi:Leucine-rich repeat (LRR) protein
MTAGNIPPELSQLSSLKDLFLQSNNLTGTLLLASASDDIHNAGSIPAELSQLTSLEGLYLNNNNLSGNSFNAFS